uniref:Uncharacterized protein n=1 Tax=Fagus sylvatica TaxID=28930 RepID=A0A2N9FIE5_FAGSY
MVLNIDLNALPMDEDVIFDVTSPNAISDQSGDNVETHHEVSKELKIEDQPEVDGGKDISYVKQSAQYLKETSEKVLRSRVVGIVKMLNHSKGRTTWEGEEDMRKQYPLLFQENKK